MSNYTLLHLLATSTEATTITDLGLIHLLADKRGDALRSSSSSGKTAGEAMSTGGGKRTRSRRAGASCA